MVAKVKNSFKSETISKKISIAEYVIKCMKAEPLYANPEPTMEALETAKTALHDAALAAANGGTTNTATMYAREEELNDFFTFVVAFVQIRSKGIPENIRLAGMEVQNTERKPSTLPEQPQQLTAGTSTYAGEILLKWKKVENAQSYSIEKSADGINGWEICGKSTKSTIAIGGFTTLTYTWFRVTALGSAGESPVSEVAKGLAV